MNGLIKALAVIALLALLAVSTVGTAQVWYPYADSYNYDYYNFQVYDAYNWYGNQYAASVASYNMYDHYGYSYGNVWTDMNSANWGYGSYWYY